MGMCNTQAPCPHLVICSSHLGVVAQVVASVAPFNFNTVRDLAHVHAGTTYALGIHPMFVDPLGDDALDALRFLPQHTPFHQRRRHPRGQVESREHEKHIDHFLAVLAAGGSSEADSVVWSISATRHTSIIGRGQT